MQTVTAHDSSLVTSLEDLRDTPLDLISADQSADVVRQVLRRDEDDTVDVARFGSSI